VEIRTFDQLLEEAKKRGRRKLAVVFPEEVSLHAAILGQQVGIAAPVLVGPPDRIAALLQQAGVSAGDYEVVPAGDPVEACRIAVQLAHDDRVDVLLGRGADSTVASCRAGQGHGYPSEQRHV